MFLYTPTCHTIFLSVSFVSLLSAIVHLLPQINVRKNMCTALFCVICAVPVFIMLFLPLVILSDVSGQVTGQDFPLRLCPLPVQHPSHD